MSRLSELAEYVGVSQATISRALSGKAGVSESTRNAVLTALDVLGYERPSNLRRADGRLVGLVMPELRNPVFPAFAEVIGASLAQRGATPVLCTTTHGGRSEAEYVNMLLDRQVSGVIFVCGLHQGTGQPPGHYRELLDRGMPMVAVNGVTDELELPCISVDDDAAVDLAVRHLADLGHRRIGLVTGTGHVVAHRKTAAFAVRMRKYLGVEDTSELVENVMYTVAGGQAAATRLIERGVTGIVCGSDMTALGAIRAAHRLELEVPGDVSVVGFDDSMFMPLVHPPVTTVRQPVEDMARAVVDLLLTQVEGRPVAPTEILYEPELVVRSSTGVLRGAGRRAL